MSVRQLWRLWVLGLVAVVLAWLGLTDDAPSVDAQGVRVVRPGTRMPDLAPSPQPVDPTPAVQALSQSTLWGPRAARVASGASGAGEAEVPPPAWGLTGYYENAGIRFVIVSFERQARSSQQLKVADKLPDGSRIERIEPDRVRVRMARPDPPEEGASAAKSAWLAITPGLLVPAAKDPR